MIKKNLRVMHKEVDSLAQSHRSIWRDRSYQHCNLQKRVPRGNSRGKGHEVGTRVVILRPDLRVGETMELGRGPRGSWKGAGFYSHCNRRLEICNLECDMIDQAEAELFSWTHTSALLLPLPYYASSLPYTSSWEHVFEKPQAQNLIPVSASRAMVLNT